MDKPMSKDEAVKVVEKEIYLLQERLQSAARRGDTRAYNLAMMRANDLRKELQMALAKAQDKAEGK